MNKLSIPCPFCDDKLTQLKPDFRELRCSNCEVVVALPEKVYWKLRFSQCIKERSKPGIIMSMARLCKLYDPEHSRPHFRALKVVAEAILEELNQGNNNAK